MNQIVVKSAERVLDVLELLARAEEGLKLHEIADELGYPRSSAHGLLGTLLGRGYVLRDEADRYHLDEAFRAGFRRVGSFEARLQRLAAPILNVAHQRSRETVYLAVPDQGWNARILTKLVSPQAVRYDMQRTVVSPPEVSVMGRMLMAHADPARVDAYLAGIRIVPTTPHTVTSIPRLREILAEARIRGWAEIVEEMVIGGCGICAPVRDATGTVVAVVNIATIRQRFDTGRDMIMACVIEAAAALSARLGWQDPNSSDKETIA